MGRPLSHLGLNPGKILSHKREVNPNETQVLVSGSRLGRLYPFETDAPAARLGRMRHGLLAARGASVPGSLVGGGALSRNRLSGYALAFLGACAAGETHGSHRGVPQACR